MRMQTLFLGGARPPASSCAILTSTDACSRLNVLTEVNFKMCQMGSDQTGVGQLGEWTSGTVV